MNFKPSTCPVSATNASSRIALLKTSACCPDHAHQDNVEIAVDIGGTFTDGIAHAAPGNRIWVAKCLTTPDDPGRAVSQIVDELLDTIQTDVGRQLDVTEVVHGTTLVTNTIIERSGARTGCW